MNTYEPYKRLSKLQFCFRGTRTNQVDRFVTEIKASLSVTIIKIPPIKFDHQRVLRVAEALIDNQTLATLLIAMNDIGDQGAKYLAEALLFNKTLTTMTVACNQIGNEGAQHLAEALKNNQTLTTLELMSNEIDFDGVSYFCEALRTNQTLGKLSLQANHVGDLGAEYLAEALLMNQTLTELNLGCNKISNQGAQYFADALKMNMTLNVLDLHSNEIDGKGELHLGEALQFNQVVEIKGLSGRFTLQYPRRDVHALLAHRGMNSGMKAAIALARNILRSYTSHSIINIRKPLQFFDFIHYEGFMARLRAREQEGRSLRILVNPIDECVGAACSHAHIPHYYYEYKR
ncbi:unnamed protein product, partial [Rotaria magnacalcarata]